jgi:hypothetical protein
MTGSGPTYCVWVVGVVYIVHPRHIGGATGDGRRELASHRN